MNKRIDIFMCEIFARFFGSFFKSALRIYQHLKHYTRLTLLRLSMNTRIHESYYYTCTHILYIRRKVPTDGSPPSRAALLSFSICRLINVVSSFQTFYPLLLVSTPTCLIAQKTRQSAKTALKFFWRTNSEVKLFNLKCFPIYWNDIYFK